MRSNYPHPNTSKGQPRDAGEALRLRLVLYVLLALIAMMGFQQRDGTFLWFGIKIASFRSH